MGQISKELGSQGETYAVNYLTQQGYKILAQNFRSSQGEIDIIAQDGEFLVFVEVKNYSFRSWGRPVGAVRKSKKQSIIHAAQTYLYKRNIKDINCRFDVLSIYRRLNGERSVQLIKNAFQIN